MRAVPAKGGSPLRFKLSLEYVGTRYSGWQIQKNARTVQGELIGPWDGLRQAGLRALRLRAHRRGRARPRSRSPTSRWPPPSPPTACGRINDALPSDVNVLAVERAPHRFHARHEAIGRSYLYQVSRRRTAFAKPFVWWVKDPLTSRA